jgi:Polyketide cyclase / dehydrase and lipid transport
VASIRKQVTIDVGPDTAWAALRDYGALHELATGFVVATEMDGNDRLVTFGNGAVLRERLISIDEDLRRVSWAIVDGPYSHHNGAAEVLADGDGRTRFIWTADLLPDETAESTDQAMGIGIAAIKRTLERRD